MDQVGGVKISERDAIHMNCIDVEVRYANLRACLLVVAFSSRARILGECSIIHSPPAFFFF